MNRKNVLSALQRLAGVTRAEALFALLLLGGLALGVLIKASGLFSTSAEDRVPLAEIRRVLDSIALAEETTFVGVTPEAEAVPQLARGDTVVQPERHYPAPRPKKQPKGTIDLNTASRSALMSLPGIGPATADKILAYRAQQPFRRPEDLLRIKGIGKVKLSKVRQYISVSAPGTNP